MKRRTFFAAIAAALAGATLATATTAMTARAPSAPPFKLPDMRERANADRRRSQALARVVTRLPPEPFSVRQ